MRYISRPIFNYETLVTLGSLALKVPLLPPARVYLLKISLSLPYLVRAVDCKYLILYLKDAHHLFPITTPNKRPLN